MFTADELSNSLLQWAQSGPVALRAITKLQPVGGTGDKVAPPTYADATYAKEKRLVDGKPVDTVLLDSVQSQVNRFEETLLDAFRVARLSMPLFEMTVAGHEVTSLTVPHRVHDAIFRDSLWDGKAFRESEGGRRLSAARAWNAAAFYEFAPTALLFGTWDSQSGSGVNSAKIARSLVSEIIAFDAVPGVRTSSRIDPLGIKLASRDVIVRSADPGEIWKFESPTIQDGKKTKKADTAKTIRPSEINHGNVTPTITGEDGAGGITFSYALQTTVLSFTQLRRLRFPDAKGASTPERDAAGRAVIAALGLTAVTLQWNSGFNLRSRCELVPEETPKFELIGRTAKDPKPQEIDCETSQSALAIAVKAAEAHGLTWRAGAIRLEPRPDLVKLVEYSDKTTEIPEGGSNAGV